MQFTTFDFLIFFPAVVLLFYVMPKRARQLWLLLASYYFYMGWHAGYALLLLAATLASYVCGILLGRLDSSHVKGRRLVLAAGIMLELGMLAFFKYFYFLHDAVKGLVSVLGSELAPPRLSILLPVGISFYTFQALGYLIDVYRGDAACEKNFIRYALFVSFFPQLVAGPIERSGRLLCQLDRIAHERSWDLDRATRGLLLMLWGFFMKMVIADRAGMLVDQVYELYHVFNGVALLIACVLFAVQIYCDFASYSVIAVGAAQVLGIELMMNFEAPFFSTSIRELWRRWHVSLSSWFRDYVYIPLGGNRCTRARRYANNMITFTLSGLWHGASWHFVVWGAIQGAYIVIGDLLRPVKDRFVRMFHVRVQTFGCRFFQGLCTFGLFSLSLVFFRADTVEDAVYYLYRMSTKFDVWSFFDGSVYHLGLDQKEMAVLLIALLFLIIVDACHVRRGQSFDQLVKGQCLAVQYVIVAVLLVMVVVFGVYGEGYDPSQFIYFQF